MGVKFTKASTDGTIVCDPRGGWSAKMGLQDNAATQDWTELRIGAFVSITSAASTDAAWSAESISSVGAYDYWMFGLKDADTSTLFKVAGTQFWGCASLASTLTDIDTGGLLRTNASGAFQFLTTFYCTDGTTVETDNTGTGGNSQEAWWFPDTTEAVASTNYATFIGLQFIRTNPGTASQAVQIYKWDNYGGSTNADLYTDTSESNARTLLNAFSSNRWTTGPTITANTGAAAFTVPDYWYIRWPFVNSRLRIHSAMYVVVSP